MPTIKIRNVTPDDAKRLVEIYSYYVDNTAITYEYDIPTTEEFRERIIHTTAKYPYLVLEEDGIILGYAYAGVFKARAAYSRCCELSIYLDQTAHKRGFGRLLYEALEDRLKAMGMLNLYAFIASPIVEDEYLTRNSEQFHYHLGFRTAGEYHKCGYKFGRWYNMICMEKIIGSHDEIPAACP